MDARRALLMADMIAPSPSEWGPHLWKMLHWLAQHSGKQRSKILQADELAAWTKILTLLQVVLPCAACRTHYTEYFKAHFNLNLLTSEERGENIRRWLWELHEDVNRRREVNGGVSYEDLQVTYESLKFAEEREAFYKILERAQRQNIVLRDNVLSFKKWIATLYSICPRA